MFENDPLLATAPALLVTITDTLDPDLDRTSFELGDFAFGNIQISAPPGLREYSTHVNTTNLDGSPLRVNISGSLNLATGQAIWTFSSIDPATGAEPNDPEAGFLPVNDASHRGEGHVTYRIRAKPVTASGTTITNQAQIVFDENAPILTPSTLHTLDVLGATSRATALPAKVRPTFLVKWGGNDDASGAGVGSFDVFVSDNNGPFVLWMDDTADTSAPFTGEDTHTYRFYTVATDLVGHFEAKLEVAEAETNVVAGPAWQNPLNARDASQDTRVVPLDALIIINELNGRNFSNPQTGLLIARTDLTAAYYDVNGDVFATPNDALNVINFLNELAGEAEGNASDAAEQPSEMLYYQALAEWLHQQENSDDDELITELADGRHRDR